jgi:hypothetical protein
MDPFASLYQVLYLLVFYYLGKRADLITCVMA